MKSLVDQLLSETKPALERGLREAEQELEQVRSKARHLEEYIVAARQLLAIGEDGSGNGEGPTGSITSSQEPDRHMTLHDAMAEVLRQHLGGLRAPEIAAEINRRNLYRKRDGSPIDSHQIHARVGNYHDLFEKRNGKIVLR